MLCWFALGTLRQLRKRARTHSYRALIAARAAAPTLALKPNPINPNPAHLEVDAGPNRAAVAPQQRAQRLQSLGCAGGEPVLAAARRVDDAVPGQQSCKGVKATVVLLQLLISCPRGDDKYLHPGVLMSCSQRA